MSTPQPSLNISRTYVKGISLEMPNAPGIFLEQGTMDMNLDVAVTHQVLSESIFEVVVRGTLTAKMGDKVVYLVEVQQGGVFEHKDVPAAELPVIMGVACPTMLYPYLRAVVSDVITRASLPAFYVMDINWAALFAQQQQAEALANTPAVGGTQ